MKAKNKICRQYTKYRRFENYFVFIESLVIEINELVSNAKTLYYDYLAKKNKQPIVASKNLLVNS